jgi:hypothetical protein
MVENERVFDANGNVSMRNTFGMEYNAKRLLTDYDADTTDALGNKSHINWTAGNTQPIRSFTPRITPTPTKTWWGISKPPPTISGT